MLDIQSDPSDIVAEEKTSETMLDVVMIMNNEACVMHAFEKSTRATSCEVKYECKEIKSWLLTAGVHFIFFVFCICTEKQFQLLTAVVHFVQTFLLPVSQPSLPWIEN